MRIKTKARQKGKSQNRRSNTRGRILPGRQDGNRSAKPNVTRWAAGGLSVLTTGLRPKTHFELCMCSGDPVFENIISIVDTEAKQLQCIEDLHAIVKAQPKYKNLKEPIWREDTQPAEVLLWLLRKLGPLAQGEDWTVDTYKEGKKTRYQFVVYKRYSRNDLRPGGMFLCLDFLPFLKKRDEPLHNLIIDVVAHLSKCNRVPLWDEDGDYSGALEFITSDPSILNNFMLEKQYQSYKFGTAYRYLQLIKLRRKQVTRQQVSEAIIAYDDNSQRKQSLKWWLRLGIDTASYKQCIKENTFIPGHITGHPYSAYRHYKFVWSLHDHDVLKLKAQSQINKDIDRHGSYPPMRFTITRPGQKMKKLPDDHYPISLYQFMDNGQAMFISRFRDYFYKDMLEDPNHTPSERLLMEIEKAEIKNAHKK